MEDPEQYEADVRKICGTYAAHIARTIDSDPDAPWIFVLDQLNTHKSEALVRLVAERCGIEDALGVINPFRACSSRRSQNSSVPCFIFRAKAQSPQRRLS